MIIGRRAFLGCLAAAPLRSASGTHASYALFDSALIERSENTRIVPGTVRKDPAPLFSEDKPWEVRTDNTYANVLYDESAGLFKCWYSPFIQFNDNWDGKRWVRSSAPVAREMAICYATSKDGVEWRKPELGLVEFAGNRRNNMIWRGPHGSGIFLDRHETDRTRRFKIFYNQPDAEGKHLAGQTGMRAAFSADGLHWSQPIECPGIAAAGDTHNNAFWDERSGKYVGITRLKSSGPDAQRVVGRTESPDFVHWTKAEEVLRGDVVRQSYAMPVFPYCQGYLGLLMVFDTAANTVDCELAWSLDTVRWERIAAGTPLIPRGPEGSYDHGCIFAAAYPVARGGDLSLYYGGNDRGHNGPRKAFFCRAHLRADGFACVAAQTSATATVITRPIAVTGRRLRVTADAAGGRLSVGIAGHDECSIERCSPISADVTGAAVAWRGTTDLARVQGKSVPLHFEFQGARLYTIGFTD